MTAARAPRLWLALRPLNLPLQALVPTATGKPICILEKQTVICANDAALRAGISLGMDATTARLLSDCQTHARQPELEQQLLEQLAERLYAFTPYIEIHQSRTFYQGHAVIQAGLLLEISRCLTLFSGLVPLCEKIFAAMVTVPFAQGLAHSAQAAWLLSYHHYPISGDESTSLFMQRLHAVPVQTLPDYPEVVEALHKTGFVTLGDIAAQIQAQSISSIKKRFGETFALYLGAVFGMDAIFQQTRLFDQPARIYQPREFFFDILELDYPVSQWDQLYGILESMLQKLADYLRRRQLACQQIEWKFFDIHHNSEQVNIRCDKSQSHWQLLYELTRIQLERRQLPFAVDALELTCRDAQKQQNSNHNLNFTGGRTRAGGDQDLALLEARLKARLGEQAIFKVSYNDAHLPEQSHRKIPVFVTPNQLLSPCLECNPRPAWLFEVPLAIGRRHGCLYWRGSLQLISGPERIEGQWWDESVARDYYVAQRGDGLRVLVYRDLMQDEWFTQGVFA